MVIGGRGTIEESTVLGVFKIMLLTYSSTLWTSTKSRYMKVALERHLKGPWFGSDLEEEFKRILPEGGLAEFSWKVPEYQLIGISKSQHTTLKGSVHH